MRYRGAGAGVPGRRGDGLCEKHGSRGLLGFAKNKNENKNNNTKRFSLCRLFKLRTEQKIQTAEVKVKRMQGVEWRLGAKMQTRKR